MPPTKEPFTLTAPPNTDVWRKPPTTDVFNAPTNMTPKIPLTSFLSSKITFSFRCKYRYDQGCLLLHLTKAGSKDRWVKTGIEFYQNKPYVSTVGCDNFADWSILPTDFDASKDVEVTIEVRREVDENGKSLWVYWVQGEEMIPLREIAWFFAAEEGWDIAAGALACRPANEEATNGESLQVKFWDFALEHEA
ncbi:f3996d5f-8cee-4dfd-9078-f7d941760f80 [Sclerotinia trifoliorum]|uniref:F3996d5f-8cee-4dfd-9078-f7d941760f80 n=1 Tax=Sclerotinia trifoliorum TaxID=28548 RepID=A0A8H2W657_9HELO|nr:f3996d5f-8cee-4dfd-9078-f7d941760f80 [Sclerotinia trifoliorum]